MKIGAIVLAAGFSNRFGSLKLCAPLRDGMTVFQRTLANLRQSIADPLVITRAEVAPLLRDEGLWLEVFPDAEQGMGATLAYGVRKAAELHWDGCLVCLADMPFIRPDTYRAVRQALREDNIVVPSYRDREGNPAGFGRFFFPQLSSLHGDRGGRAVLQRNRQTVVALPVDDPAILYDIDTPDDLARYDSLEHA